MADEQTAPATPPEFPKPLVRLVVSGLTWAPELILCADADAEAAATAAGFEAVTVPPLPIVEFPKWRYHRDGRRFVVPNQEASEKLGEGFEDLPQDPEPKEGEAVPAEPPAA